MDGRRLSVVVVVIGLFAGGCELFSDDQDEPELPAAEGDAVLSYLDQVNYEQDWRLWPGTEELYEGSEPHGMLLTTYMNDAAYDAFMGDSESMPNGAIIVKENYTTEEELASVTTMYKVEGYNADHNDWFWMKNGADGVIEAAGQVDGCQSCHSARPDNDYLFTSPLNE